VGRPPALPLPYPHWLLPQIPPWVLVVVVLVVVEVQISAFLFLAWVGVCECCVQGGECLITYTFNTHQAIIIIIIYTTIFIVLSS